MKVAVTGASGLIGSEVCAELKARGHSIVKLVRKTACGADEAVWDPAAGTVDAVALRGVEAVVHLAGEPIRGRWTKSKKARITESRVTGTGLIARTVARLEPRPRVLVCASAYGIYGDRGAELLTEDSAPGVGFLAGVAKRWEAAAQPARDAGVRAVHTRFGLALSPEGGALKTMLLPWRLGMGARLGAGRQFWPWVSVRDAARAVVFAVENEALSGPVNVVAPQQVTNAEFTRALGRALSRPAFMRVPAWAVSLLFGQMGREMFLASQRTEPAKLKHAGFEWRLPELEPALRAMLRDGPAPAR